MAATPSPGKTFTRLSSSSTPSPSPAASSSSASSAKKRKGPPSEPRPSSSVLLISPRNEILLLRRVHTSSSFASAYVFPGGNLDAFHDGDIPGTDSPKRHQDGPAYRLGAIRETFEETGILLAKRNGVLLDLPQDERDEARKKVHGSAIKFGEWLKQLDAVADVDALLPFTRWITPSNLPKRFTTQMYLYLLPISHSKVPSQMLVPTPDNGVEHTEAVFASPHSFLAKAAAKTIILHPPQAYLLTLISRYLTGPSDSLEEGPLHFMAQRKKLLAFLRRTPTAETDTGKAHHTANIPWAEKVMCPSSLLLRKSDGRAVMSLEKPGAEIGDESGRGGDFERVMLVNFSSKSGPTNVEMKRREDVLEEERKLGESSKEKL